MASNGRSSRSTSDDNGDVQQARRLGVVVPRLGDDTLARAVLAGVDSRRRQWETRVVLVPPRDTARPPRGWWVLQCFWFLVNSMLLLLLGLALLVLRPVHDIVSDGIALRLEDDYAIVAFLLRILNTPLALALLAGAFYGVVRGARGLGFDGDRLRRAGAWLTRTFIFFLVVGTLEIFPRLAQRVLPGELPRSVLGILLILGSTRSHFRLPPRTKMDVVFMAGLSLTVEGVASLLWDSGLVWQGWGRWFAIAAALAAGLMWWLRRRHRWKGVGFESSARALGRAVAEARALAHAIRTIGLRYLIMPKAPRNRPLDPLDFLSRRIDAIVLYDPEAFEHIEDSVPGGEADPPEAWTDVDGWQQRQLRVSASSPPRSCTVYCPRARDPADHDSVWLYPKDSLERLLDSLPAGTSPQGTG